MAQPAAQPCRRAPAQIVDGSTIASEDLLKGSLLAHFAPADEFQISASIEHGWNSELPYFECDRGNMAVVRVHCQPWVRLIDMEGAPY